MPPKKKKKKRPGDKLVESYDKMSKKARKNMTDRTRENVKKSR